MPICKSRIPHLAGASTTCLPKMAPGSATTVPVTAAEIFSSQCTFLLDVIVVVFLQCKLTMGSIFNTSWEIIAHLPPRSGSVIDQKCIDIICVVIRSGDVAVANVSVI